MQTNWIEKLESNVENDGLLDILKNSLDNVSIPFDGYYDAIYELEFKRRDGFVPYRHNKGGIDFLSITDYRMLIVTGCGLPEELKKHIKTVEQDAIIDLKKDSPELVEGSNEWYQALDEHLSGEYNEIAYRIRIMYHGNNELTVFSGYDLDAPYFRGNFKYGKEKRIKFKNKKDLKNKLEKYLKKL